jgi:hypothetical protein
VSSGLSTIFEQMKKNKIMVIYGDWKLIKICKIDIFNQSMHLHPIDKSLIPLAILFSLSHHLGKCIQ